MPRRPVELFGETGVAAAEVDDEVWGSRRGGADSGNDVGEGRGRPCGGLLTVRVVVLC